MSEGKQQDLHQSFLNAFAEIDDIQKHHELKDADFAVLRDILEDLQKQIEDIISTIPKAGQPEYTLRTLPQAASNLASGGKKSK